MNNFKRKTNFISWLTIVGLIVSFIGLPTQVSAATPVYKYEWVDQSGNVSKDGLVHEYNNLQPGQTINLSLTMINRSGKTIQARNRLGQSPDKQVPVGSWGIGTQNPQDGTPSFLDSSSFVLNNNRFVYYDGEKSMHSNGDTPNGWMINFSWTIKLKDNLADGIYYLNVRPVCEYLAWTRQVKNGVTLPGTDSDIYWKFRVGSGDDSDVPAGYVRYVNPRYSFSFVYPKPVYPIILGVEDNMPIKSTSEGYIFMARLGALEGGNPFAFAAIERSQNLNQAMNKVENHFIGSGSEFEYVKSNLQRNGVDWTVFTYETKNYPGDPYGEVRVGQLPNGYILIVSSSAGSRPQVDQMLLDSVKPVTAQNAGALIYTNNVFGFSFQYPNNYTIQDDLPKSWTNQTGPSNGLAVSDKSKTEAPGMTMYVNPDGWGPFFPDIRYNLALENGKVIIANRTVVPADEYNQDGRRSIITDPNNQFGGNYYWFLFGFKEGGDDYEQVFQDILNSFMIL